MRRFKNILACVDADREGGAALGRAAELAELNGAALRVVAVHEGLSKWGKLLLPKRAREWEPIVLREVGRRLDEMAEPAREAGIQVSTAALVGVPFIEVIREVLRGGHDLLIKDVSMTAHGGAATIGSTDMHLLRKCPCPVWLVKPAVDAPLKRILAAVDPEPRDEVRNALNTQILELATSLARMENCELYVVRAWESMAEEFRALEPNVDDYEQYMEQIHAVRLKTTEEFIGRFESRCDYFSVRCVMGAPEVVIAETVEQDNIDLVVMGTVASTGIPGFLIGSTAESVLRQIKCSVLGVKPDGFVSPVTLGEGSRA
jgi:universal stress protein E